jgi:DNA-binding ferritin-like protein
MAKKIVSFQDFNKEADKADLQNTSRGFSKNSNDGQQIVGNQKMVFNKITRKWDSVTKDMIDDQIEGLEDKKD